MSDKRTDADDETIQFNVEQRLIEAIAPQRWKDLKDAVIAECEQMSATIHLDIRETERSLRVHRVEKGLTVKTLSLEYDPHVPRIIWKCSNPYRPDNRSIFFCVRNRDVFYVLDNAIEPLPSLIQPLTMCVSGD